MIAKGIRVDFLTTGVVLFILITVHNSSQFGASLSMMLPGCLLITVGSFINTYPKVNACPLSILVFWLTIFLSTLASSVVPLEQDVFSFAIFLLAYYLVARIDFSKSHIRFFKSIYICSALVVAFAVIRNWMVGDYYISWTLRASYRFLGENKDPNYVTAYIVPAAFYLFLQTLYAKKFKQRCLYLTGLLVYLVAILCTGSRAPVLSLASAIGVYYIMDNSVSNSKRLGILIIGGGIVYALYRIYMMVMPEQVFDRIANSAEDSRLDLWKAGIRGFTESPIFGSGLNSSNYLSNIYAGNHCHNVYIDAIASCGLFGMIFMVYFIHQNCFKSTSANNKFILASGLAFLIPLFFINGFNSATFLMPLMMMTMFSHYCRKAGSHYGDLFE